MFKKSGFIPESDMSESSVPPTISWRYKSDPPMIFSLERNPQEIPPKNFWKKITPTKNNLKQKKTS